jgi:hypothetical protein
MHPIDGETAAAGMSAQRHALAKSIEKAVARVDADHARAMLAALLIGFMPALPAPSVPTWVSPTPTVPAPASPTPAIPAPVPRHATLFEEVGTIWVRPRRATKISGIGLTKLYQLIAAGQIESRRLGGARLISVASLLALGEEQAPQFPAGLAAARQRRAER